MMDADDGFPQRAAERGSDARADEQRSGEARPLRIRDPVERGERDARLGEHLLRERNHAPHVVARRKLRHDSAVDTVHRDLRMQRVREEPALAIVEREAGFVARGFDAEYEHVVGWFARLEADCYTIRLLPVTRGARFMTSVRVRDNEPFEVALRRFKRTIEKTGLLTELRAREFYEKPTAERKRKLAAAVKRHYKRLRSQQLPPKLF